MKNSITQEMPYGCGIACFAFVCDLTYQQAEGFLGPEQAKSDRFIVKHFVNELNRFGKSYVAKHLKSGEKINYAKGAIVLLRRSKKFPVGHYLTYYEDQWMDPRINLQVDRMFIKPTSGFRKRLPGQVMYVLYPVIANFGDPSIFYVRIRV